MRATHPSLLLLPLLAAALIALNPLTVEATDLVFLDSKTRVGVKIALREPTSLIVIRAGAVQLTLEGMVALKLQPPPELELAERPLTEKRQRAETTQRQEQLKELYCKQNTRI